MRPRSVRDGGGAKRARGGAHTVPGSRRAGIRRTPETKGHGKTLVEIAGAAGIHNNEALSNSLTALALSGIVSENPSWSLKTTSLQKRNVRYRVEDPYTRFYIKKMDLVTAQLEESGYAVIPDVVGTDEISNIERFIDDNGNDVAGTRRLINRPWCRELASRLARDTRLTLKGNGTDLRFYAWP